jgi:hypothetical protein
VCVDDGREVKTEWQEFLVVLYLLRSFSSELKMCAQVLSFGWNGLCNVKYR